MRKPLDLSADLVARVERAIADPGPDPERIQMGDDDYAQATNGILAALAGRQLHVFGYGSLLWKPEFDYESRHRRRVFGWHRSFCMQVNRFRGSHDQPGLMMALELGGACEGELFSVERGCEREELGKLLRREIPYRRLRPGFRWINVRGRAGPERVLTFYAGMRGDRYYVELSLHQQAHMLARAAGHGGTGAAYLYKTIARLAELGIHDEYLWRLQHLVAAEIRSLS